MEKYNISSSMEFEIKVKIEKYNTSSSLKSTGKIF